jgi:hypothetical protein
MADVKSWSLGYYRCRVPGAGCQGRRLLTTSPGTRHLKPDTRKWAFSALSLVSGVWIGTATA